MADMNTKYTIELDEYERCNLLAAIMAIAQYQGVNSPMVAANNGDWVMQVAYKLGFQGYETDWGHPNYTPKQIAASANFYIEQYRKWRPVSS